MLDEICCTLEAEVVTCKEQLVPPGLRILEGRGSCPEAHFIEVGKRQHASSILQAIFKSRQGLITVQTTQPFANLMQGNEALRVKDSKCKFVGLTREVSPGLRY